MKKTQIAILEKELTKLQIQARGIGLHPYMSKTAKAHCAEKVNTEIKKIERELCEIVMA